MWVGHRKKVQLLGAVWPAVPDMAKKRDYDTSGSQVITDLSTKLACGCLTSQIGRDVVFSTKYGRNQYSTMVFVGTLSTAEG